MPSIEEPPFTPEWRRAHAALGDSILRTLEEYVNAGGAGLTSDTVTALAHVAQAHYMAASLNEWSPYFSGV